MDSATHNKPAAGRIVYSMTEAQKALGIGHTKFQELVNNGALKSIRIGRRRLIRSDALLDFLASLA